MDGLNYKTLDYKPVMAAKDEEGHEDNALDLLVKTWDEWGGDSFINPVIVNKYYVARPDLISLAVYGNDKYGDMICKFNGISNPFDLNEDMVIQIPPYNWVIEGTRKREHNVCDTIDDEEDSFKPKDYMRVGINERRTASELSVLDPPPYVIDKTLGIVIY